MEKLKHEKIIKDKVLNHGNIGEMICNVQKQKKKQTKNNETKQQKREQPLCSQETKHKITRRKWKFSLFSVISLQTMHAFLLCGSLLQLETLRSGRRFLDTQEVIRICKE